MTVDLCCMALVMVRAYDCADSIFALLIYNFCAFALQMPLGLFEDRLQLGAKTSAIGCALTALAFLMPSPLFACVCAGVGNALFHVGCGTDTLRRSNGKAWPIGAFVAPGAI